MSGSLWLDDVLLPKKPKENVLKQPQEFTYTTDTVILDEVMIVVALRKVVFFKEITDSSEKSHF